MPSNRSFKVNILQSVVLLFILADLLYGLFFITNLDSLSSYFNLTINQPEDKLWRQILGLFFLTSATGNVFMLFAPMLYRHLLWMLNVMRPLGMVSLLLFSSVAVSTEGSTESSWITQQDFFFYLFVMYLALALLQFLMLHLTKGEAMEARKLGMQ